MSRRILHDNIFYRLCIARDLIHARYDEPLLLTDIAQHVGISRYHFLRLFREAFGATPHEYLTRVRLDRAKHLLAGEQGSVTTVCFDVGFQSVGSFSTLFAERVGCPPGAWRRRFWQVARRSDGLAPLVLPWCYFSRFHDFRNIGEDLQQDIE